MSTLFVFLSSLGTLFCYTPSIGLISSQAGAATSTCLGVLDNFVRFGTLFDHLDHLLLRLDVNLKEKKEDEERKWTFFFPIDIEPTLFFPNLMN